MRDPLRSLPRTTVPVGKAPRPEWVVGHCPECGGPVVITNYYYRQSRQQPAVRVRECWGALQTPPTCAFRQVQV